MGGIRLISLAKSYQQSVFSACDITGIVLNPGQLLSRKPGGCSYEQL